MRVLLLALLVSACGAATPTTTVPVAAIPADAAVPDAAPPDADVPAEVLAAPAWIFRYDAAGRLETWTLRYHGADALVTVERAAGTTRYVGAVATGAGHDLALTLAAGAAPLALTCKPATRPIGATCGDTHPQPLDVLDCFHPDFAAPMTFAAAPGIAFVATPACTGYVRR